MIKQLDFYGYPYVGIYASNTEDYVVLPPDLPEHTAEEAAKALGVNIIKTLINDSTLIGSMMTGNSNGFIVSDLALDSEVKALAEARPVARLKGKMTAAGNIILVERYGGAGAPAAARQAPRGHQRRSLKVDVKRGTIGGLKTVGMAGVATNKGSRTPQGHGGRVSRA